MKSCFLALALLLLVFNASGQTGPPKLIGGINTINTINTSNAPCSNIDFESVPLGTLSPASGWTVSYATTVSTFTAPCWISGQTYTANPDHAIVAQTPIFDINCNGVAPSPLGGQQILVLNKNNVNNNPVSLAQNFSVTASNFIFRYAYKIYVESVNHSCCDAPQTLFNFYDCSNNLISAISKTITGITSSLCPTADTTGMTIGGPGSFTPDWVVCSIDLSPYLGSCITVEVIAARCSANGHPGYCYYDAECASSSIWVNNESLAVNNYMSCSSTATLASIGFSDYVWQGPPASGVSGSTLSTIFTNVAGIYTLNATNGIFAYTQTLSLNFTNLNTGLTLSSPASSICIGEVAALQSSGNGISTYTWSTGANTSSISVSPNATTQYFLYTTNTAGCLDSDSLTVTVFPLPQLQISASATVICPGESVQLAALTNASSVFWNTGASVPSLTLTPALNSIYHVTVTSANGCVNTATQNIQIFPSTQVQITTLSGTICPGAKVTLVADGIGITSYTWNNGSTGSMTNVTPTITSSYSISGKDANGCVSENSIQIIVDPCVGINEVTATEQNFNFFPNPFQNEITLQFDKEENYSIIITDITGKVVYQYKGNALIVKLSLAQLPIGLYELRFIPQKGEIITRKLIRE